MSAASMSAQVVQAALYAAQGIPSPSQGVWWLGPIPLRAYGIIIMCGMLLAVWWSAKRYAAKGGNLELLYDIALWTIPSGIIGARAYHVLTHPWDYFGADKNLMKVFYIWEGGIAIWGGIIGGALAIYLVTRHAKVRLLPVLDAIAPTVLIAQAIGRWGNYFNQELFGGPTTLPWGLQIDDAHLPLGYASGTLFHPTFLYESIWNISAACILIALERRLPLKAGQLFGAYLIAYPLGRMWIENMRLDEAQIFFGMRVNFLTSLIGVAAGILIILLCQKLSGSYELTEAERYVPGDKQPASSDKEVIENTDSSDSEENTTILNR